MNEPRYVQHVTGTGTQWKLKRETSVRYIVHGLDEDYMEPLHLPKSDYRLVEPPERWVDVTARLVEHSDTTFKSRWDDPGVWGCAVITAGNSPYRLRKVELATEFRAAHPWAFIVEKREP